MKSRVEQMLAIADAFDDATAGPDDVDGDGPVHFAVLPGSVAKNRHLLDHRPEDRCRRGFLWGVTEVHDTVAEV